MQKRVLILTDHSGHSAENALYSLARTMMQHSMTHSVYVASRALRKNKDFFEGKFGRLLATPIDDYFEFSAERHPLDYRHEWIDPLAYDLIWLRLPPPLSGGFLSFLSEQFSRQVIINRPQGILETGSKAFLLNFAAICPPMRLCRSASEIRTFAKMFPIVLKPLHGYGGQGIVRIDGEQVWEGRTPGMLEDFLQSFDNGSEYLAVKFMQNFHKGDKRIIVVNGEIMGASLRLPAPDSWLCNVAMGGSSQPAQVNVEEEEMVQLVNPILLEKGIVMYGLDTLEDENGIRKLSEINTSSIGGLPQIAEHTGQPLLMKAIDQIWCYFGTHGR